MPKWLKILLGVLAVGIISVVGLSIWGVMAVKDFAEKAADPKNAAKVFESFATTSGTLPPGFDYQAGMDMGMLNCKFIALKHQPNLTLVVGVFPLQGAKADNSEAIMAQLGTTKMTSNENFESAESGEETVGGEKFPYKIGTSTNTKTSEKNPTMMGVITPNGWKNKAVIIIGTQEGKGAYDMDSTKQFLGTIKAFHE